jgi:hypothetical protein
MGAAMLAAVIMAAPSRMAASTERQPFTVVAAPMAVVSTVEADPTVVAGAGNSSARNTTVGSLGCRPFFSLPIPSEMLYRFLRSC